MSDKLKAFVSSSMNELRNERFVVKHSLAGRGIDAFVFELDAGARPEPPNRAYLREVEDCDLYIGLFWNRYSQPTVDELHHATRLGKPRFIYVKDFDVRRSDSLAELLSRLSESKTGLTIGHFSDVLELGELVRRDVQSWFVTDWRDSVRSRGVSPIMVSRLSHDAMQMANLRDKWDAFCDMQSDGTPPHHYVIELSMPGVVGIDQDERPIMSRKHMLELQLHGDYPMSLPFARLQVPIFHPNVWEDGKICMGWHRLPYHLAEVVVHVARMIDFQIYSIHSCSNYEAAKWAQKHEDLFPLVGWEVPDGVLSESHENS